MIRHILFICTLCGILSSCSSKISFRSVTGEDIQRQTNPDKPNSLQAGCYDPLAYVEHPELIRTRYVRVNFHFMNSSDGQYNMAPQDMETFAKDWVYVANHNLERNVQMHLPPGNTTPVLPIPYRYVLTPDPSVPGDNGVYHHMDDTLCYVVKTGRARNISDKRAIKKYAVRDDSILNIFVMSHHLDSITSPTYKPGGSGISLGSSVKIFGEWFEKPHPWNFRGLLNHEVGHSLGLSHTWTGNDGCDDTPPNPNCYNKSEKPPCDSVYSNNMMDYNHISAALTPCQIGKVLMHMAKPGSIQRNILEPRWCVLDTTATITISDSVRWRASADLERNIVIENGGTLEIACRIAMPESATITVKLGGKLVILSTGQLHNACGDQWGGVIVELHKKSTGRVIVVEGGKIENSTLIIQPKS